MIQPESEKAKHQREASNHADRLPEPDRLAVSAEGEILQRRLDDAARLLEKALVLRPDDKRFLLRLAQVKAREGFAESQPIAERALALDPSFVPAQDFLGVVYAFAGQNGKCEGFVLENARRWPSPLTYTILEAARIWAGDYLGALEAGQKSAELFGASGLSYLALDLLLVEDFEHAEAEARRRWTAAASAFPGGHLEIVLRSTGKRKEARRVLDEMERAGAGWFTHLARIQHAAADGDRVRLRSLARQAAPDTELPWLALTLALAGDVDEVERLLREHPVDQVGKLGAHGRREALDVLAALRERERGDAGAARQRLEAARRRALVPFAFDYFLGETCHLAGDDLCAVAALSDGRRILMPIMVWWPGSLAYPRSLLMLAGSLGRLGRREEAVRAADKLLALWERADPDLPLLGEAKALRKRLADER